MNLEHELRQNLFKLHTTVLGVSRVKRNLSLDTNDVTAWCKAKIEFADAVITSNGKNWYVRVDGCVITINRFSYTIITAHREKKIDKLHL